MDQTPTIARSRLRRLYYIGTAILLVVTLVSFIVPAFLRIGTELTLKIEQLSESIINQKKAFLKSTIVEKISDIERIRAELENRVPSLNPDEFDRLFRIAVKELIYTTDLPDDGYIWINEIVDYDGGDEYAIRLAHPNLMDTEGDYLSTNATDVAGNLPYLEELDGIKKDGEVFFDYYFPKLHSDVISHKLSFAKLYEPYDWIIATGMYLDDVDMLVEAESKEMRLSTKKSLLNIGFVILAATAVLLIMTAFFETRIQKLISMYLEALGSTNEELRLEKTKLENANHQKDHFYSIVAHDLSSPIGNLRILSDYFSSIIEENEIDSEVLKELSSVIGQSVSSMGLLLEDLLMWSRAQRNALEFNPERHPAANHAKAAIKACAPVARSKGVVLTQELSSSVVINADNDMVKTILRNLISNAIKFTTPGGTVSVELSDDSANVFYSIRDTGTGMSMDKIDSLFQKGSTPSTPGTNSEKGTGLGLQLCKEFIDQHNGTIRVTSKPGEGSEIVVTLPLT